MGRRTNIAYPVAFVLFVIALYYFTFVRLAAEDPVATARAEAEADAEEAEDQRGNGAAETRRMTLAQAPLDVAAPPVGKPVVQAAAVEAPAYDTRIGVLMTACNRPDVQRALDTLFRCVQVGPRGGGALAGTDLGLSGLAVLGMLVHTGSSLPTTFPSS